MAINGKDGLAGVPTSSKKRPGGARCGMRAPGRPLAIAGLAIVLSGCAGIFAPDQTKKQLDKAAFTVGAVPMDKLESFNLDGYPLLIQADGKPRTPTYLDLVGKIIGNSKDKCRDFMAELDVAKTNQDFGLDAANTVFGALGTAFSPVGTSHAFSAAGSITSGWKTALDSDFYAKAAIDNYEHAIQSGYYKDMDAYGDTVEKKDPALIVPSIEYAKVQTIHAECSLAAAQATINASVSSGAPAGLTSQTQTLTLNNGIGANQTLTLVANSSAFKSGSASVTVPQPPSAEIAASEAAAELSAAVNANSDMKSVGISATHPASPDNTVVLSWPSTVAVNWTLPSGVTTPAPGAPARGHSAARASMAPPPPPGSFGPVTSTTSNATSAVVPGHAIVH